MSAISRHFAAAIRVSSSIAAISIALPAHGSAGPAHFVLRTGNCRDDVRSTIAGSRGSGNAPAAGGQDILEHSIASLRSNSGVRYEPEFVVIAPHQVQTNAWNVPIQSFGAASGAAASVAPRARRRRGWRTSG